MSPLHIPLTLRGSCLQAAQGSVTVLALLLGGWALAQQTWSNATLLLARSQHVGGSGLTAASGAHWRLTPKLPSSFP